MAIADTRTDQERNPHPELVHVRNSIQECCKNEAGNSIGRKEAARITNHLTHAECDKILAAKGDEEKVQTVASGGWRVAEEKREEAAKKKSDAKPAK